MRWIGIAINTPTLEAEEAVTHLLINAGTGGVAVSGDIENRQVTSYLPDIDQVSTRLSQICAAVSLLPSIGIHGAGTPVITEIDEEDWANSWKAYFKPIRIGRRLIVSPPWERADLQHDDILITIDPGMAFGTGTHATTQLCMVLLEEYLCPGNTVADIGTGSGILSITAAKLGADKIIAVDNDPLAVKIAHENTALNSTVVQTQEDFPSGEVFDVVVANIIADTLIALAEPLAEITTTDGLLIVSGVIEGRENDVRSNMEEAGFHLLEIRSSGEWKALAFRKFLPPK